MDAKFKALLEASPDAIVVTNEAGRIIFVNTQVEKLFGYRPEDLLGQEIEILMPGRIRHIGCDTSAHSG